MPELSEVAGRFLAGGLRDAERVEERITDPWLT